MTKYTSDSDLSEDTRDLVNRGLATVRRKWRIIASQSEGVCERFLDSNMDIPSVRHPSGRVASIGYTLTHGLMTVGVETAISQNQNTTTDRFPFNLF